MTTTRKTDHRRADPAAERPSLAAPAPWRAVRVHMPGNRLLTAHAFEDAIRGRDKAEALANAWLNWPDASHIDDLGHDYTVGERVSEVDAPYRFGHITEVAVDRRDDQIRLHARFDNAQHAVEVARCRIRPAEDAGGTR